MTKECRQREMRRRREDRVFCRDHEVAMQGGEKSTRINLGLELLQGIAMPGVRYSYDEIAAWAGCTDSAIVLIEQTALKKLRRNFRCHKDERLAQLIAQIFEERRPAQKTNGEDFD